MTSYSRAHDRMRALCLIALRALIFAPLLAGLAACQNIAATTGISYNEGLAKSYNSVLLMNIIRSAKNYPLYNSAIGDFSADFSTDIDLDPSIDIPFSATGAVFDGDIDVDLAPTAGISRDYNANASSLETEEFIAAMNTRISAKTLLFFTEGRSRRNLSLILMILVDRLAVTHKELEATLRIAKRNCQQTREKLSVESQGICRSLETAVPLKGCDFQREFLRTSKFAGFRNDPSNPCEFAAFKHFIEALRLSQPRIEADDDGTIKFILDRSGNRLELFTQDKTGVELRSPHETIAYLGEIVRQTYIGNDRGLLTLAGADGKSIPIFHVEEGKGGKKAAISARVDGEKYWIPKQSLHTADTHYSFQAMSVIKDIVSLNTSDDQLPTSSTRLILD